MAFVRGKGTAAAWLGRLVVAVLLGVLLHFAWDGVVEALHVRSALRTLAADEAGRGGGVVVHGTAHRARPTVPTSYANAVAWLATVGEWQGRGKNRRFHVSCIAARVDGLTVEDASTHKVVTLDGWNEVTGGFPRGLHVDSGNVAVDFIATREGAVLPHVESVCRGSVPSQPEYTEHYLEDGAHVTVRGCLDGETLRPCGDGVDVLTAGSLGHIAAETRTAHTGRLFLYAMAGVAGVFVLGAIARRRLVRVARPDTSKAEQGA